MMNLLLRGFVVGLAIAAPVGPIGVICIRRTLAFGRLSGFASGLGAAAADAVYGAMAAFGLTMLSTALIAAQNPLRVFGGLFLCYLGLRTWFECPRPVDPEQLTRSVRAGAGAPHWRAVLMDFGSTFLLTITNPMTILSFSAIFVSLGALGPSGASSLAPLAVVAGVFGGSASWWLFLSSATNIFRVRFLRPEVHIWVARLSGALILIFGLLAASAGVSAWMQGS